MALIRLIGVSLALAGSFLATSDAAKTDFEAIREIDIFLMKKIPETSDDTAEMMERLREKLKREDKSHLFRKKNSNLINVLKLLTELRLIDAGEACSDRAYELLKKCDRITDGDAHRKWLPNEKHRLVDKIVHHYGVKKALTCLPVYAKKYEEVMKAKADSEFNEYMQPFLTRIILRQICGAVPDTNNLDTCGNAHDTTIEKLAGVRNFTPGDAVVILEELLMRSSPEDAEELQEAIMESTHDESNRHKAQKKLRSLVDKHFVSQCNKFIHKLPPKFLDHVAFDAKMLDKSTQSESLAAFHVGLANYRLCQALIIEPEWLGKFVLDDAAAQKEHEMVLVNIGLRDGSHHHQQYPPSYPPPAGNFAPQPHHHYRPPPPGRFPPHHF